jgi:DNA-binding Lrp family transcriptional regulator
LIVEIFEDIEGVIVGPHASLERRWPLDDLEKRVYDILLKEKKSSLSQLWRRFDCHLWELVAALNRLKKKGLVVEENFPI